MTGIPLLGIYPKRIESRDSDTCMPVFITALFKIAKRWKQPSVHQWMNGLTNCGICMQWNIIQP